MNKIKDKKKIILIGIIGLVIIVLVIITIITNTNKNSKTPPPMGDTSDQIININYDNMDNAKIDKKGNKVCTASDLDKEHKVLSMSDKKKNTNLSVDKVKIWGDKEKDITYAEVPLTNNSNNTLEDLTIDVILLDKIDIALLHETIFIDSLKPKETYTIKLTGSIFDITNTKTYEVWLMD